MAFQLQYAYPKPPFGVRPGPELFQTRTTYPVPGSNEEQWEQYDWLCRYIDLLNKELRDGKICNID